MDPTSMQDRFKPQTWNRYAYALGNPLRFVDPNGADEREGIQAGVVTNNSSTPIWIAADVGGQIVVIPLETGESSTLYITDTDAVVVESGSDSTTIDGASTGAYKVGAGEVVASDDPDNAKNTELSRSLGYVISYFLGRAGYVDQNTATREGWVVPAASTAEAEEMNKKLREEKQREERGKRRKEEEDKKDRASRIRP